MPDFDRFLMRHSEGWMQDIIEQIERSTGVRAAAGASLEDRWHAIMQAGSLGLAQTSVAA